MASASLAADTPGADTRAEVIPVVAVTRVVAGTRVVADIPAVADIPTTMEVILVAGPSPSTLLCVGKALCRSSRR